MSELSSDSNESVQLSQKKKRYKLPLCIGYEPHHVSLRTRKNWEKKRSTNKTNDEHSDGAPADPSCSTAQNVCTDDDLQQCDAKDTSFSSVHMENTSLENNSDFHEELVDCNDQNVSSSSSDRMSGTESSSTTSESSFENEQDDFFSTLMFEQSNITVAHVVFLITAFSRRHNISDEAVIDLIEIVKTLAGPAFTDLKLNKYTIHKFFSTQENTITYHYFCANCEETILYSVKGSEKKIYKNYICNKCEKQICISLHSMNYFLTINLAYQIKQLLSNSVIVNDIINNMKARNDKKSNDIEDVNDNEFYTDINHRNRQFKQTSHYIFSLNFSVDGAPLTKSGKRSFWPLQLQLNDLSLKCRFRIILLTGILTVCKEPTSKLLNLFLSTSLFQEIHLLNCENLCITVDGQKIQLQFIAHTANVDSVCRPIIQNRVLFNGYEGCSWCYQKGEYQHCVHGIRYIFHQDYIDRSNESHTQDVQKAINTNSIVRGVKGTSMCQNYHYIDMVWTFAYEYMHGLLLSVCFQIINEWKKGNSSFRLTKNNLDAIEKRYLNIKPSHDIHRLPRKGIINGSLKPKAAEMKHWLLLFSLCCLKGILNDEAMNHYILLVKCSFILLKSKITLIELQQCEKDLLTFVCRYEMLYGKKTMTFNLHSLLHVVKSVKKSGPLITNSAFPYESNICNLKKHISGPNSMDKQMAHKFLQTNIFKFNLTHKYCNSDSVVKCCENMFLKKKLNYFASNDNETVTFCGKPTFKYIEGLGDCLVYKKCIYRNKMYHSINYFRANKTDDSVIQLSNEKFCRIHDIIDWNGMCYLRVANFQLYEDPPFEGINHLFLIKSECNGTYVCNITELKEKVCLINCISGRYIGLISNNIEIQ